MSRLATELMSSKVTCASTPYMLPVVSKEKTTSTVFPSALNAGITSAESATSFAAPLCKIQNNLHVLCSTLPLCTSADDLPKRTNIILLSTERLDSIVKSE